MTFRSAADHPASPLNHVGVAVKVIDEATAALHVGLVYRLTDGVPRMAHLAFHHDLRDEAAPTGHGYAWADCGWLQDPDYASSGAFVARFIQGTLRRRDVRYGLNPDLDCYATGQLVETDPRFGLTCATYIAAVLKGAGFDILDIGTWVARPGDEAWSRHVLALLDRYAPARAEELRGQVAPFRVRPDEMAAAVAGPSFPVTMEGVGEGAAEVLTTLRAMG